MDISYIKKIIKLVENSNVDEIEIEEEGKKIRVSRSRNFPPGAMSYQLPPPQYYPQGMPQPAPAPVA
ncbi:MAG: acetyl-CoA carboxylase biotin carboxyl carrier protein, partial [Bacteroidota bacterium]